MTEKKEFQIRAQIGGEEKDITVKAAETSDSAPYYICFVDGKEVTEIRQEGQEWKQIWKNLSDGEVQSIGNAISEALAS